MELGAEALGNPMSPGEKKPLHVSRAAATVAENQKIAAFGSAYG
jgi:hypothetical protein